MLPDENSSIAVHALHRLADDQAVAPNLLVHEIRNILLSSERRGRIAPEDTIIALKRFEQTAIQLYSSSHRDVVEVARKYRLSAYDAVYLALALETNYPLATLDRKLIEAAVEANVEAFR